MTLGFESGPLEVSSVSRGRWWDLVDTRHRFPNTVRESHRTSGVAGISARLQAGRPPLPWERGCSRKHPRAPWLSAGIEPEETEGTRSPSASNRRGAEAKRSLCGRAGLGGQRWTLAAGGGGRTGRGARGREGAEPGLGVVWRSSGRDRGWGRGGAWLPSGLHLRLHPDCVIGNCPAGKNPVSRNPETEENETLATPLLGGGVYEL